MVEDAGSPKRQVQMRFVASLIPYPQNSRTHSDSQVAKLAGMIQQFGFTNPILIDEKNTILAGHGRTMAARKLGLQSVPVIVLDGLTDAQKRAYVIADNRTAEDAGWDDDMLAAEIQRLKEQEFDLQFTGFDPKELEDLLAVTIGGTASAPSASPAEQVHTISIECKSADEAKNLTAELTGRGFSVKMEETKGKVKEP